MNWEVYSDLSLYIAPDKFFIHSKGARKVLTIDRINEYQQLYDYSASIIPASSSCQAIVGIIGCIRLINGKYLIVVTDRNLVGQFGGHEIWQMGSFEIIPYNRQSLHLTSKQIELNERYLNMMGRMLRTPSFYFSYTYDITHTFQRLHQINHDFHEKSLFERAEGRFTWNKFLLDNFMEPNLAKFCLPIIHGYVSVNQCVVNGTKFVLILISRRSNKRAGCRYFRRGIDSDGNVANFVETEQIVDFQSDKASFVQIRGSIPLFWSQLPNLKYKPKPELTPISEDLHKNSCEKHLQDIVAIYGRQVLVNLIDHKGSEQHLEIAYKKYVTNIANPMVQYEAFDFHNECKNLRWDRLSILLDRLASEQDELGFFLRSNDGSISQLQDGVFRTNCIDCLDRTNVVQSMIARRSLTYILRRLGIIANLQSVENFDNLEQLFKEIWANNADILSRQYSGTGALKTDYTRTGKRTKYGVIDDGVKSLSRYFINNFSSGFTQDSVDLFLGEYQVVENEGLNIASPLDTDVSWRIFMIPSLFVVTLSMFTASLIFSREYTTEYYLSMVFWGSMMIGTSVYLYQHGTDYVNQPKLTKFQ